MTDTARGPIGREVTSKKTFYRHGRYSVEVDYDGAIRVLPGDSLRKYSAAIHNSFCMVNEFGRMVGLGLQPIPKDAKLHPGDVIFHIPTYLNFKSPRTLLARPPAVPLSDSAKKELRKAALAEDFGLRGEPADIVEKAFTILDCGEKALPLAELAGLVAEGGLFVSATSFAAGILFPLGSALAVVKAMQGGERLAGMVAIAYTITAWVFDETVPGLSPDMQQNLTFSGRAKEIPAYQELWKETSAATLDNLAEMIGKAPLGVSKKDIQALEVAKYDNPQTLCQALLSELEKDLDDRDKKILETYEYPK